MKRKTHVFDDPESGQMLLWDKNRQMWIDDELLEDLSDDFQLESGDENEAKIEREIMKGVLEARDVREGNDKDNPNEEKKDKKKKKRKYKPPPNKSIYIQGLPVDVTQEELVEFCKKAGIIEKDPLTKMDKVRIYTDDSGVPKGDALVTYFVDLAIQNAFALLDGAELRPGNGGFPLTVQLPQFDPSKKKQKLDDAGSKPAARSKKQKRYNQMQELTWEENEQTHVILEFMFDPQNAFGNVFFYDQLKREIEPELAKCGPIASIKVFERNPDGVIAVKFETDWGAARCIEVMNDRFFDGRKIKAHYYDGFTNYFVAETEEERLARDSQWEKWLDGNDEHEVVGPKSGTEEKDNDDGDDNEDD